MIWIFMLVVGIVIAFTTLGAFSVWLKVFAVGLKLALLVISVLTLAFIWKHIFKKSITTRDSGR